MIDRQETGRHLNIRAENSHLPFRRRERAMSRFWLDKSAYSAPSWRDVRVRPTAPLNCLFGPEKSIDGQASICRVG